MGTINDPNVGDAVGVGMGTTTVWSPMHVAVGPLAVGAGGAYRLSMLSGIIPASVGLDSELFQFRYVTAASRVCLVHGVSVAAAFITAPAVSTTTVQLDLGMRIARSWSADGSGGTAATLSGDNQQLRTAHTASEVTSARMATTAALGAGTKTEDTNDIGLAVGGVYFDLAAADISNVLVPKTQLLGDFEAGMAFPVVLADQEGFVIRTASTPPATMTWELAVDVIWSEVDSF